MKIKGKWSTKDQICNKRISLAAIGLYYIIMLSGTTTLEELISSCGASTRRKINELKKFNLIEILED